MTSDRQILNQVLQHISQVERQGGRAPTVRELARAMGMKSSELRIVLSRLLANEKAAGTSVLGANLKAILLGEPEQDFGLPVVDGHSRGRDAAPQNDEGSQLGFLPNENLLDAADDKGLELHVVRPETAQPGAQLINYDQFKSEQDKRALAAKKTEHTSEVKEVKLLCEIDDKDYKSKVRSAEKFLQDGDNVKVSISLKGQEIEQANLAMNLLKRMATDLGKTAKVADAPKLDGKIASMMLSPVGK